MSLRITALLEEKRLSGDLPADDFIRQTLVNEDRSAKFKRALYGLQNNSDIDNLQRDIIFPVITKAKKLPEWANLRLMRQGSEFFAHYAPAIMNLLGMLSLPYSYAAADGAMVLSLSGRMQHDVHKRLLETAGFVWKVMAPNAFSPEGSGFAATLQTRLIHAITRFSLLKSGNWENRWGYPINQEDMAGTNLSFSLIVIRGLRKLGHSIGHLQQESFMHLWKVIGYLVGVEEKLIPATGKEAFVLESKIRDRQFRPSEHGKQLAASLITFLNKNINSDLLGLKDIRQVMQFLLEPEVAIMIGIEEEPLTGAKIRLLQLLSTVREISSTGKNPAELYREGYWAYKKQKL